MYIAYIISPMKNRYQTIIIAISLLSGLAVTASGQSETDQRLIISVNAAEESYFCNEKGERLSNLPFQEVWCGFREGMSPVKMGGKFGYVNEACELLIPCKYDRSYSFHEGMAMVVKRDKCGFIDKEGKLAIPCKYKEADDFESGLAAVNKKRYGSIWKNVNE